MEYFFSGTIDRIIFENASNFFKILLLEIEDTDSDFDDLKSLLLEQLPILSREKIIRFGVN